MSANKKLTLESRVGEFCYHGMRSFRNIMPDLHRKFPEKFRQFIKNSLNCVSQTRLLFTVVLMYK